ncbi:hypothetical protein O9992_26035 [Vibrio lentus]|nr:hypothetical protein [Vibrio lentus]
MVESVSTWRRTTLTFCDAVSFDDVDSCWVNLVFAGITDAFWRILTDLK